MVKITITKKRGYLERCQIFRANKTKIKKPKTKNHDLLLYAKKFMKKFQQKLIFRDVDPLTT